VDTWLHVAPRGADDSVEQVKAKVNLVEVVRQYVPLRRRGRDWWGICPFHQEKTPSFKVTEQLQSWYCFGCQQGGDVFDFVERVERIDFRGALEHLAEMAGVELRQQSPQDRERKEKRRRLLDMNALAVRYFAHILRSLPAGESGRELLAQRGVDAEVAARFDLGYAPGGASFAGYLRRRGHSVADATAAGLLRRDGTDFFQHRLVVPIRDERGRTLAFAARTVLPDEVRKYVNTPETPVYVKSRVLFGLDVARQAIGEQGHAVVMEGQFDVIVAHQFGIQNAVASSGTALTSDQVALLKRFTDELVLVFDNDTAGRTATYRAVEMAAGHDLRTKVVRIAGEAKDPDEFLRGGGDWSEAVAGGLPGWEAWLRESFEELNPHRPEDLDVARRRAQQVLDKITEPALWAGYEELAKRLLDIDPHLQVFTRPRRRRREQPAEAMPEPDGAAAPAAGNGVSNSVGHLLRHLAVCPEAVERVRAVIVPEDLEEGDRTAYLRLVDALRRGGRDGLEGELHHLPPADQQLIHRAWASPPPGASVELAEDIARKVRRESLGRRRRAIINGLADAERRGDAERVAELERELMRLAARE
jgi:DNA primase